MLQNVAVDISKDKAHTCSVWSAAIREPAVSMDFTVAMYMRQGFLASGVFQVCLRAGASSFSSV